MAQREILDDPDFTAEDDARQRHLRQQIQVADQWIKAARRLLYILAILLLVTRYVQAQPFAISESTMIEAALIGLAFTGLGILSYRYPILAFSTAIFFYSGIEIMAAYKGTYLFVPSILWKVVVLSMLLTGLVYAIRKYRLTKI